jgi:hypothetical protein
LFSVSSPSSHGLFHYLFSANAALHAADLRRLTFGRAPFVRPIVHFLVNLISDPKQNASVSGIVSASGSGTSIGNGDRELAEVAAPVMRLEEESEESGQRADAKAVHADDVWIQQVHLHFSYCDICFPLSVSDLSNSICICYHSLISVFHS